MTNQDTEKDQPPSSLLNKIKRFFTIKPSSLDDVSVLLEDALSARLIDKEAQFIAERAIRLGDTTVKAIMVPRVEMVTLAPDEDPMSMINRIIDSGHSRYPVLGPAKNEVQGILLAKDLLPIINKDLEDLSLNDLIRDIKVVPESKKADSLLEEFKKDRSHMAIVMDEYGTISGLVTIEDILEELVGEIEDEHDFDDEDLIQVSEHEYIADATLELSEFENKFNKKFNGMDAETLAGLFINKLGFLPKVGDKIELDDMILAVTAADKRKIKKLALQLKQIYKSPLASYIFLGLVGGLSTLAFSPFNIKLIIPFTLATLIYSTVDSRNIIDACKRTFSWGLGYWMCGTGWLIVSIHYYGNTDIIISSIIILLMGMLLSAVFITPFALVRFIQFNQNIFFKSLAIASILIILEFSRFLLLGGFPWLLPGLVFIDTLGQTTIPIFGVYGASYIIYFFSSLIAFSVLEKRKNFLFLGVSFLLIFIPYQTNQKYESYQGLNLSIIQPSLDPFKKYTAGSDVAIEDTLLDLTNKSNDADLIIWPESPLPYLNSDPRMTRLISKLGEDQTILSGSWQYRNNKLHNSMTILGSDQTYLKRHLVPFGEYVPFEGILRGLIEFFDMPMSSLSAGSANQDLLQFRNFKFLGLICFDIAFPLSYLKEVRKSDFIVNISNDTWFGSSYGPYQHLQIVRARALEANKWIARGTSDGISTIVDNNGTIVSILEKGTRGSLVGSIQKTSKTSFFYTFGYLISPILSIIMLMTILILKLRK